MITQEELQSEREETMRKAFRFAGVDESFTSEQFDREWEKSSAKQGDKYQVMEKLVKLPGLRSFDRNFDRLPESLRWIVEKVVHDPEKPPAPKPKLPDDLFETHPQPLRRRRRRPAGVRRPRVRRLARLLLSTLRLWAPAPDPGPTTVEEQLDRYRPGDEAREDRPFVAMNFAATVDGRATIGGRLGADRLGRRHGDAGRAAHAASTR